MELTRQHFFYALVDKRQEEDRKLGWVVFPWEGEPETSIESNIQRLIQYIEPNPQRSGLVETPKRVAKAWEFWTSGYETDIASIFKVFDDGAENYDEMITVSDIPFYSHCEHHLAPFFGKVTISYIPTDKIVGLSKLCRLVNALSRRLQVQERLTSQIANAITDHLKPLGVGVKVRARHLCMESRGVCQQGHSTTTTCFTGVLKDDPRARSEFLHTAK